jgi:hypothetical protein
MEVMGLDSHNLTTHLSHSACFHMYHPISILQFSFDYQQLAASCYNRRLFV